MRGSDILGLYRSAPLGVRLHVRVRWWTCPFGEIARRVPPDGPVLELGCGYGLMANLLALESPGRSVLGTDVSREKISGALLTVGGRENIRFEVRGLAEPGAVDGPYRCILLLDVLYLLPLGEWKSVLSRCYHALMPGGVLLIKEQSTRPRWKYWWNRFQEFLAVRVLRITEGTHMTFPGPEAAVSLLEEAGFAVETVPLDRWSVHPHILFHCRKP